MADFETRSGGVALAGEDAGEGIAVVLLHGLTASRRYVVMGSKHLERSGHRVVAYDARGHGRSAPAPDPAAYGYEVLAADLIAVLDDRGIDRAVLAGASMGAHTLLRLALDRPERVAGAVVITPAFDPEAEDGGHGLERWDRLADGLRTGGVEGFVEAYGLEDVPEQWRGTVGKVLRQRLAVHEHPAAVADALSAVPRSRPFEAWADLARLDVPVVVVADRDEADPGHPLAVGEFYAASIPGARLVVEDEGKSPLAWQGGQLSKVVAERRTLMLEITGPADGLLDDPLALRVRGGGELEVEWRARFTDDDGHVWRAVADRAEDLVGEWAASAMQAGSLPALASLRPVRIDVRAEAMDGRAARRSVTRGLLGPGVRRRRWRDGVTATLCLPAEPEPLGTVVLETSATAVLAAPLLASRGVLTLLVADGLDLARERLAALPAAAGEPVLLDAPVPSPLDVDAWDGLLARVGARPRA